MIGAGSLTFAITLGANLPMASTANKTAAPLTIWVRIGEDNKITIYSPAAEMGQGSLTSLPLVFAEEFDANWDDVRVEHAPLDTKKYGRMMTVGSRAVSGYYETLRQAGAQARYVLLKNVAKKWKVSIDDLSTSNSVISHKNSDRTITYGEVASFAEPLSEIPKIPSNKMKNKADFKLIGKTYPRLDIPEKVDGSAKYSGDTYLPGMHYAVMRRSPVNKSKPLSYNQGDIEALTDVTHTVSLDHGVAVVAKTMEAALRAADSLKIKWSKGAKAETYNSEAAFDDYKNIAHDDSIVGRILTESGDMDAALKYAHSILESSYQSDHAYHAQMEPFNAIVSIDENAKRAEVWAGSQAPVSVVRQVARITGFKQKQINLNRVYLGGGFGRRTMPEDVAEATQIAMATKKPIKLLWTRTDDMRFGAFRPQTHHRMRATKDTNGKVTGIHQCLVGESRLATSGADMDYYDFPNHHFEQCSVNNGVRLKHWRGVGHGVNKFVIEGFIDEIAADQNIDPYLYRRGLMHKSPKELRVLETVAEMADWNRPRPKGRALGIACAERSASFAAGVAEVSLDQETGKISVHKFWACVDPGTAVQPDNIIAQMEGGIIFGLSSNLKERVTFKGGAIEQSNFYDYPLLRMSETPEIEVKIVESGGRPTGIGETGLPITGGAVANAIATLTGKRLRHMPFTPERVLATLKG
jgi:isoquinoline 1-oxidoreductase beta subunit